MQISQQISCLSQGWFDANNIGGEEGATSSLDQIKGVFDYFVPCKIMRNIRERKHVHFTRKIYNQLVPHNHETRSRVNNKLVIPRYSKSKCQNALIFRRIKLWNTTLDDTKP